MSGRASKGKGLGLTISYMTPQGETKKHRKELTPVGGDAVWCKVGMVRVGATVGDEVV